MGVVYAWRAVSSINRISCSNSFAISAWLFACHQVHAANMAAEIISRIDAAKSPEIAGYFFMRFIVRWLHVTGRARIGSPSKNLWRSALSAAADSYLRAGSFCKHL